jgi:hypothetical protein
MRDDDPGGQERVADPRACFIKLKGISGARLTAMFPVRPILQMNCEDERFTGDGDTRVAPLHARKMTARLQAANGSDHAILLLYDTKSGHSGGRPINKIIEESTDILSFVFWQLGVPRN